MAIARARRDSGINYWPGFVDALSTLVLGIIFLLTVFVVVQFYLTQEVSGKDTALTRLNAQIAQLTDLHGVDQIDRWVCKGHSPERRRRAVHSEACVCHTLPR